MKGIAALLALVAVLAPAAYATGQALDPRVPGLKRQVTALRSDVAVLQGYTRCIAANQQGLAEYELTLAGTTFRYLDYAHGIDTPHGFVQYPPGVCPSP